MVVVKRDEAKRTYKSSRIETARKRRSNSQVTMLQCDREKEKEITKRRDFLQYLKLHDQIWFSEHSPWPASHIS
jgi:hypothetical protein